MKYYQVQNLIVEKNAFCSEIRKDLSQILELKKAAHQDTVIDVIRIQISNQA